MKTYRATSSTGTGNSKDYTSVGIRMFPHRSRRDAPNENLGPVGSPYFATSSAAVKERMGMVEPKICAEDGVRARRK